MSFLFKNMTVFDGKRFFRGSVLTEGEKVVSVLENDSPDVSEDTEIIESDSLLMPGMINSHTHIPMSIFRSCAEDLPLERWLSERIFPLEKELISREMCYSASRWGMLEMLRNGITACSDMYFFEDAVADAALSLGMKIVMGEGIVNFRSPAGRTPSETLDFTRQCAEKYRNSSLIYVAVAPHSLYLADDKYIFEAAEISEKFDLPFHIHLSETEKEVKDFEKKFGLRPFQWLAGEGLLNRHVTAAHCVHVDMAEIELMAEHKITVAHCPSSNMKLAGGIAPIRKMMQKGVNVMVATDGAASNNSLDLISEACLAAKVQKVISKDASVCPATDMLCSLTSNAEAAFGAGFGVIKEGSPADLVLMDISVPDVWPFYEPAAAIIYSNSSRSVDTVLVNGRKVVEKGNVLNVDYNNLRDEIQPLVERVSSITDKNLKL